MAYVVHAADIPITVRKPGLLKYRSQLKRLVKDDTLPESIRGKYRERLSQVESTLEAAR